MENVYEITLLMDFYGQLLTERQFEIMDLHYNNDYSLGEIAEYLNISRQGVFDNIKRGKASLNQYENKLGLVKRFSEQKEKAKKILELLKCIDCSHMDEADNQKFRKIEDEIKNIVES